MMHRATPPVLGLLLIAGCAAPAPEADSETGSGRAGPIAAAQQFVGRNLKAPATASFPWSFDEYTVVHAGGPAWVVRGYVDSQNGFGANLRTRWTVKYRDEGGRKVLEGLAMD